MIYKIKDYIKGKPRIYDIINRLRPINSDLERWIDEYSKSKKSINFIQVGASDGLRWDPYRKFIVRDGWKGLLIEPIPPVYDMLKENYRYVKNQLKFINAIITSKDREAMPIWTFNDDFLENLSNENKMHYLRLSSVKKDNITNSIINKDDIEKKVVKYNVQAFTISTLLRRCWCYGKLDLIAIDAEGHDDDVIRGIDFEFTKPEQIIFETHKIKRNGEETKNLLKSMGYKITEFNGDAVAKYAYD